MGLKTTEEAATWVEVTWAAVISSGVQYSRKRKKGLFVNIAIVQLFCRQRKQDPQQDTVLVDHTRCTMSVQQQVE